MSTYHSHMLLSVRTLFTNKQHMYIKILVWKLSIISFPELFHSSVSSSFLALFVFLFLYPSFSCVSFSSYLSPLRNVPLWGLISLLISKKVISEIDLQPYWKIMMISVEWVHLKLYCETKYFHSESVLLNPKFRTVFFTNHNLSLFFRKGKFTLIISPCYLRVWLLLIFWTRPLIFTKLVMHIMSLKATMASYFLIPYDG